MIPIDAFVGGLLPHAEELAAEGVLGSELLSVATARLELTLPVGVTYLAASGGSEAQVRVLPPTIAMSTGFDPVYQRLRIVLEPEPPRPESERGPDGAEE